MKEISFKNAGRNIKTIAKSKAITQTELAEILGYKVSNLNHKLNNKNPNYSLKEAAILSKWSGISIEQIFLGEVLPIGN